MHSIAIIAGGGATGNSTWYKTGSIQYKLYLGPEIVYDAATIDRGLHTFL